MNRLRSFPQSLVGALALVATISGCVSPAARLTPSNTAVRLTPTNDVAEIAASSPPPTATLLPKSTSTLTPTTTPTPLATLLPEESQALILELTEHNAGCRLPCWWGITPGETSWTTAQRFLATFAISIKETGSPEHPLFSVYFIAPKEIDPNAAEPHSIAFVHNYRVKDGTVDLVEVQPGLAENYNLSAILKDYGLPSEVRLRTFSQAREGDHAFDVVLFYPADGMLVRYALQGVTVGNQIRGCPQQASAAILALWPPLVELTFSEAANQTINARDYAEWPYRSLQEATQVDVGTFFDLFENSENPACLETPADLWPAP